MTLLGLILPRKDALRCTEQQRKATEKSHFLGSSGTQKSTWALRCGQLIGDRALSWSNNGLHRLADGCRLHSTTAYPLASIKPFNSGHCRKSNPNK